MLDVNDIACSLRESSNGYMLLENYVLNNPLDKKLLYFTCKLYEQCEEYRRDHKQKAVHIEYWENQAESDYQYFTNKNSGGAESFPHAVNFECTTICNAKCKNCSHEELISSGDRLPKYVPLEKMKYYIKKVKLMTLLYGIDDPLVLPVGLGEPLCHPQIVDILRYMEIFFKRISFTTNASLLNAEIADELANINLESITLSLSYFNKDNYKLQCGLDFERTVNNMIYYLKKRKEENSSGFALVHIFNNNLNSETDRQKFKSTFEPYLRDNDILSIRQYYEFTDNNDVKSRLEKRNTFRPCYQLWEQLTVDVDGNLFPCCIAVWKKKSDYLLLGNLNNSSFCEIMKKLTLIRDMQFRNDFGVCRDCTVLHHNEAFWLPLWLYNQNKCIHGDISYIGWDKFFRRVEAFIKKINKRVIS